MPTDLGPRVRGYVAPLLSESAVWTALLDAPVASLACDESGRLLYANTAMITLLERPLDELLGHGWVRLLCSSLDNLSEVLSSSGTLRHRKQLGPERDQRVLELTCSAVRLPDGSRGIIAIAVESAGLAAESGRLAGERGYRELVEDAPDVLARFDPDGHVLFLSGAVERVTGARPEEFLADPTLWVKSIQREYRPLWEAAVAQVQKGDARWFDLGLRPRDGRLSDRPAGALPDPRRARARALHRGHRARHHRRAPHRGAQGQERGARVARSLEVAAARQRVRTSCARPLVSIKGYNELLLRGALRSAHAAAEARAGDHGRQHQAAGIKLIETLLDFSRREEGRLELRTTRLDLRQAVEDAVQALAERISSRNLKLRLELGAKPLHVIGDRVRLAQVFRALLGNAEKFSEGASGEIVISVDPGTESVAIAVTNRGIGIPKEAHSKIFNRFYQVDASSTRRFGGAGLGLALAKELVTLHGGTILVESAEGRGSTFTVRLPRATRERPMTPPDAVARPVVLVGADTAACALKPVLEASRSTRTSSARSRRRRCWRARGGTGPISWSSRSRARSSSACSPSSSAIPTRKSCRWSPSPTTPPLAERRSRGRGVRAGAPRQRPLASARPPAGAAQAAARW